MNVVKTLNLTELVLSFVCWRVGLIFIPFLLTLAQVGSDSAQGAGSPIMFQAMSRITRWLVRETPTEGIEERTIRKSFLGEYLSMSSIDWSVPSTQYVVVVLGYKKPTSVIIL